MINYKTETNRTWQCPRCGYQNTTPMPSAHSELDVPAICETCRFEDEWGDDKEFTYA